jgi:hypothetical protein
MFLTKAACAFARVARCCRRSILTARVHRLHAWRSGPEDCCSWWPRCCAVLNTWRAVHGRASPNV